MRILCAVCSLALALAARADEGLWTFDDFPAAAVNSAYGRSVSREWLDQVRLSTVRLANCSAAFVSRSGLLLTNQHCVESCLGELSSQDVSHIERGFAALDPRAERRCSTQVADVLVGTQDVTAPVLKASAGQGDAAANEARKRMLTRLEQVCEQTGSRGKSGKLTCQSVTLYGGSRYVLYKYKRYDDVRLVFAPERDIAAFGGDPDNFQFPRWSLDFALLRAYEHGAPARTPEFLPVDFAGPKSGDLVFVSGNPGSTSRWDAVAQLKIDRDVILPAALLRTAELRGGFLQFGRTNPANQELIEGPLDNLDDSIKVRRKLLDALHDEAMMARKQAEETALRARPATSGIDPWAQIETALARERTLYLPYIFIEGGTGFNSNLFRYARLLVRAADERVKPNVERLREYTDAALPRIEQQLSAHLPAYADVESLTLSFSLQRMRESLGPDHPVVRRLFAHESPEALAERVAAESKLDDPAVRMQLYRGGKAAVDASRDPMIEFARSLDGDARALRKRFENEVEAPVTAASLQIAALRFKAYGTESYPDATFTLRLNYGKVEGWDEDGAAVAPFTHLGGAFERATGYSPFKIPDSWIKVKDQLDMATPFCFSTDNDIVGGNSGSPLVDAAGRLVGLMFDGNIHSISGAFWFDAARNRAIALHPAMIREALDKVYGARTLLNELETP